MTETYGFGTTLRAPFEATLAHVREALQGEGFGVLTEIDVQRTLREKLSAEMEPYRILGACNPPLAQRALTEEREIGLLLPCNVVIRAVADGTRVDIADPEAMLGIVGNERVRDVAGEARARLLRVVAQLEARDAAATRGSAGE